jgi:hypothetical protein
MKKATAKNLPKVRNNYGFNELGVNEFYKFPITEEDPQAGARALCAAYAFGRRNGRIFSGQTDLRKGTGKNRGIDKKYMLVSRVA